MTAKNLMAPWKLHTQDGQVDITFVPFFQRTAKTDVWVLRSGSAPDDPAVSAER